MATSQMNSVSQLITPTSLRSSSKSTTRWRSEEHTSELQSQSNLVCRLLLEKKKIVLMLTVATAGLTMWLYIVVPKGFFPQQDTGLIVAVSEAAQDISYRAMAERQSALAGIVMQDPAVDGVISAVGAGAINSSINNGRLFINLKPREQRDASAAH